MINIRKNKFLLIFLFLAVLGFATFAIGGEYLHSHIHHHHDQASKKQCPVYQLQMQAFLALSTALAALFINVVCIHVIRNLQVLFVQPNYLLPDSQAPPLV